MNFFIKTFGCRVNIAESDALAEKLKDFHNQTSLKDADIVIIRACAVTSGAEQGVRQEIRNCARQGKKVFVLGCFLKTIPEAKYVKSDPALLKYLKEKFSAEKKPAKKEIQEKVRAFIKIQTGCNFNCAFCVTKIIRGKSKNESGGKIIKKIKELDAAGAQEIVLTGTNILLYKNITKLIKNILKESKIARIRFGSVDPRLITSEFINLFKNKRLMPHLHFSLQSGSEKILKDMGRPIKIKKIKTIAARLRKINPLFNISADIIVGFPGETEKDFQKTLQTISELDLLNIHCFQYSPRPGTEAARLRQIKNSIVKERFLAARRLCGLLKNKAKNRIIGKSLTALFECGKNHIYYGYTPNFLRIKQHAKNNLTGKIKKIIIKKNNIIKE
ncbi:MAG: MiaB/RimO family radical SAM methylthiotransferase [Patescibacteria group bacterium]